MPEGHSLHRAAHALHTDLAGRVVRARSPQGRFSEGARRIDGQLVRGAEAWGKRLFVDLDDDSSLHVHLGLAGSVLGLETAAAPPGARLHLTTENASWAFVAPRVCELVDAERKAEIVAALGPDPLRRGARADEAVRRLRLHPGTVAAALMDQTRIAGVGNVFRAEVLYLLRLDPRRPAREVEESTYAEIWTVLRRLMERGVRLGRIVTVERGSARTPLDRARYVYKQPLCLGCGAPVQTWVDTGRTVYACSEEQLRPRAARPRGRAARALPAPRGSAG